MEPETTTEVSKTRQRNAPGGPPGNGKALKHGLSSLKKAVNTLGNRALDKRTFGENGPTTHPPRQHHQSYHDSQIRISPMFIAA
jgi:hypothetical protein